MQKRKILIFIDWYLPGYKAGGPIKSISALISHLKDKFDFYIITSDTDFGESESYSSITPDSWIELSPSVKIFYASKSFLSWNNMKQLTRSIDYDLVYLNSYFSKYFSIYPLLLKKKKIIKKPLILAPRGMLGTGALGLKSKKKSFFIFICKLICLHKNILWHATALREKEEIIAVYGNKAKIVIASNMQQNEIVIQRRIAEKKTGSLKLFFLSRISQKKNLIFSLDLLKGINSMNSKLELNIIGPVEDADYWKECLTRIEALKSKGIAVVFHGAVNNTEIAELISDYHFLLLPTLNENYGHAIVESLMNGKPVIISDQTPWRNLSEVNAGWDIALDNKDLFGKVINQCLEMDQNEYQKWSAAAYNYSVEKCSPSDTPSQTINMFNQALRTNG